MIPFNQPWMSGNELDNISQAHRNMHLSGDGPFTQRCHAMLREMTGSRCALLTHSCTAALEIAALLADFGEGDEVILPSYTFVSTANAFVLRGGVPVFVDVRPDTLNIDERLVEAAITPRTRAICVVHYAGVPCEMDAIMAIARRHGLLVIEDAAQAILSRYRGRAAGGLGDLAALSFHETKNVICGEGGALLVNDPAMIERAEIVREKGTDRSRFFRGQVDKYTWVDRGSSYLPGEITAAFLAAQLEAAEALTRRRMAIWDRYHAWAAAHAEAGRIRRPHLPEGCEHNAHMYWLLLPSLEARTAVIDMLCRDGVNAVFHYVPLHSSPAGRRFGRSHGDLPMTEAAGNGLLRLPLWIGLEDHLPRVLEAADRALLALD